MLGEAPTSFVPCVFFSRRIVRVVFLCVGIKLDACIFCPTYFQLRFIVSQAATLNTWCRARICHAPKRTLSSRLICYAILRIKYMAGNEPFSCAVQESSGVCQHTFTGYRSQLRTQNQKERSTHHARNRATARDTALQKALASGHKTKRFKHVMSPTAVHMKPLSGCVCSSAVFEDRRFKVNSASFLLTVSQYTDTSDRIFEVSALPNIPIVSDTREWINNTLPRTGAREARGRHNHTSQFPLIAIGKRDHFTQID